MHPQHTALIGFLASLSGSQAAPSWSMFQEPPPKQCPCKNGIGEMKSWCSYIGNIPPPKCTKCNEGYIMSKLEQCEPGDSVQDQCRCDNGVGTWQTGFCSIQKCDTCDEGYEKIDGRCYNQQMKSIKEDYQKIKFDLTILIEGSYSVMWNFEKLVDFAEDIASYVDFAGGSTVTLEQYAYESEIFGLNIGSKDELEEALKNLRRGFMNVAASWPAGALQKITKRYQTTEQPNKKQVLINLTEKGVSDWYVNNLDQTAAELKSTGVTTYALMVDWLGYKPYYTDKLKKFISDPEENLFLSYRYRDLDSFVEPVAEKIYQDTQE